MSFSLATSESKARMGVIVATPTAGAAGILPGVLFSLHKNDGTPQQAVNATAIAMKSLLGLVCDPVAGLVEVPCIKRNVIGTSNAFSEADMSLAGIESRIPCDEVIEAMYRVGKDDTSGNSA